MHKLRSDSVFTQLTPEQIELLEDWLFEEKLGYREVLEKMEKEFGVKPSQSGLARFYRRLAAERTQETHLETMAICLEALATAKHDGTLSAGLFVMANLQAVQYLTEGKPSVREFTALLRALTSAQGMEMKRVDAQRAEEKRRQAELAEQERQAKEVERESAEQLRRVEENARWEARYQKWKATMAAKKKAKAEAAAMSKDQGQMTKQNEAATIPDVESAVTRPDDGVSIAEVTSPQPNGFPSPPPVSSPISDERIALSGPPEAERETDGVDGASTSVQAPVVATQPLEEKPVLESSPPKVVDLAEYARVTGRDACSRILID